MGEDGEDVGVNSESKENSTRKRVRGIVRDNSTGWEVQIELGGRHGEEGHEWKGWGQREARAGSSGDVRCNMYKRSGFHRLSRAPDSNSCSGVR